MFRRNRRDSIIGEVLNAGMPETMSTQGMNERQQEIMFQHFREQMEKVISVLQKVGIVFIVVGAILFGARYYYGLDNQSLFELAPALFVFFGLVIYLTAPLKRRILESQLKHRKELFDKMRAAGDKGR